MAQIKHIFNFYFGIADKSRYDYCQLAFFLFDFLALPVPTQLLHGSQGSAFHSDIKC